MLHTGDIFDANTLDDERVRITSFLKNRGYYNFSINNISYVADSTAGNRTVNLTMVVKRYMAGYTAEGEATLDDNRIYRIRNIYIYPDYNPSAAVSDSLYESRLDTLDYKRPENRLRHPVESAGGDPAPNDQSLPELPV